ncbi:hypothetical protein ACIBKY_29470 [Nonomuraea sp. NPDC050394]|uniref:hypothetical protein n=1 Tax=Nonomuraea sp. NPDC050394 TaxID=3364363 RepID=UPI00378D5D1B
MAGMPTPVPMCLDAPGRVGVDSWRVPAGKVEWGKQYERWVRIVNTRDNTSTTSTEDESLR